MPDNESEEEAEAGYAQVQELYPGAGGTEDQMYTFSQESTPNKSKLRQRREKGAQSSNYNRLPKSNSILILVSFRILRHRL